MHPAADIASASPHRRPWLPTSLGVTSLLVGLIAWRLAGPATPPSPEPSSDASASWPADPEITRSLQNYLDAPGRGGAPGGFQRGIALGLYSQNLHYDYGHLIDEIADHEADTISLFFNMYQDNRTSTEMAPLTELKDQEAMLLRAARQAHEHELKVLAFPLVLLTNAGPREWRGNLEPEDLDAWFESYGDHIVRLARACEAEGIEALCVGSEFSSLEEYEDHWRTLIGRVREVYSGTIFYSSNWDHYREVPFWDAVDRIGLSGYYELTKSKDPTRDQLTEEWTAIRKHILDWKSEIAPDTPLVFTEIGYANLDGTNIYPWDYTMEGPADPREQALCYEAFIRSWSGEPELGGVYFYNWFGVDSVEDTGYSPRGKPAAHLIKLWYETLGSYDPPPNGY